MRFAGIHQAEEFRLVKRSHLIAWRKQLETRALEAATVRRKLSAVASLFDYLCEWWASHIMNSDMKYRDFLRARNGI